MPTVSVIKNGSSRVASRADGMTVPEILRSVRGRWEIVVAAVIMCNAVAVGVTRFEQKSYRSTGSVYLSEVTAKFLSPLIVKSYAQSAALNWSLTAAKSALGRAAVDQARDSSMSVTVPPGSDLVVFMVTSHTGSGAALAAGTAMRAFQLFVANASNGGVRAVVLQIPAAPRFPVSPRTSRTLIVGTLVGLAFGVAGALLWRRQA